MSGLATPRGVFGVHSCTPYSREDGTFYGTLKVLDSSSLALSGNNVDLNGGSNKYPWASETGLITPELSLKMGELPDFAFELFLGKKPTANDAEADGNISTLTNKKGTSIMKATTGVTGVTLTATHQADLKFGRYVVVATGVAELTLYVSTDIDLNRGTAETYLTPDMSVAVISVATTVAETVAGFGLTFTGGSTATAFIVGDTATFDVRPVNAQNTEVVVGSAADIFPEFGAIIMAQHRSTDELIQLDAYRVKGSGMPIGFDTFAWAKPEVKAKLLYDQAQDGVFSFTWVAPQAV